MGGACWLSSILLQCTASRDLKQSPCSEFWLSGGKGHGNEQKQSGENCLHELRAKGQQVGALSVAWESSSFVLVERTLYLSQALL